MFARSRAQVSGSPSKGGMLNLRIKSRQCLFSAALLIVFLVLLISVIPARVTTAQEAQPPPASTEQAPGAPLLVTQEVQPAPAASPEATAAPETLSPLGDALPLVVRLVSDLDLLASAALGGERPVGWNASTDTNDPQLPLLLRLNLEFLADRLLSPGVRPQGWFGAVASSTYAIARDIRHDLELLADTVISPGVRPTGWIGDDPLMRCGRATQTLVGILERAGVFTLPPELDPLAPDYCVQVEVAASRYAEVNLLSGATASSGGSIVTASGVSTPITITNSGGVAFLDRFASQRVGVIPQGTQVTPVARSYAEFSNMVLVQGADFTVFIEYINTDLDAARFEALPDVDLIESDTYCAAEWCTGA